METDFVFENLQSDTVSAPSDYYGFARKFVANKSKK